MGRVAAARLLNEAQALLVMARSPAAERLGWMRLRTDLGQPLLPVLEAVPA